MIHWGRLKYIYGESGNEIAGQSDEEHVSTFKTAKRSPADDVEMEPMITTSLGSFWKGIFFAFSIVTCSKGCESS